MTLRARSLKANDVAQVQELLDRSRALLPAGHLASWSRDQILDQISKGPSWSVWSEPVSGALQAFVLGQWVLGADEGAGSGIEIQVILVDAGLRRSCLGRDLMRGLQRICSEARFWRLEVHENNTSARQFYGKLGFVPVGFRPRYYPDGGGAVLLDVDGKELAARLGV